MRSIIIIALILSLTACAAPQVVDRQYTPAQVLTIDQYRTLSEVAAVNRHVLRLEKGEAIPLKLEIQSDFIEVKQPQVDLVAKRNLFFRFSLPDAMPQERLDRLQALTPTSLSEMTLQEKNALFKDIKLFISPDGNQWALMSDRRAIKQVLRIKQGEFNLGMSLSNKEGLWTALTLKFIPGKAE